MKDIIDSSGNIVSIGDKVCGEGNLVCNDGYKIARWPVVTVREHNGRIYFGALSKESFSRFWKVDDDFNLIKSKL